MTYQELIYTLFGKQQESIIEQNLSEIKDALGKKSDKVVIDVREIGLEDLKKKTDDPNYLTDEYLTFTENGIRILDMTDKIAEMLKSHIPTSVKELTIPSTFLKDLTFLKQFPNLETLNISDYSYFSPEEIEYISKHTNIKNLLLRSSKTFNDVKCLPGFTIINGGNIIGRYGDLTMRYTNYNNKWQSYLNIYTSSYDEESISTIKDLYSLIRSELTDISRYQYLNNIQIQVIQTLSLMYQQEQSKKYL